MDECSCACSYPHGPALAPSRCLLHDFVDAQNVVPMLLAAHMQHPRFCCARWLTMLAISLRATREYFTEEKYVDNVLEVVKFYITHHKHLTYTHLETIWRRHAAVCVRACVCLSLPVPVPVSVSAMQHGVTKGHTV